MKKTRNLGISRFVFFTLVSITLFVFFLSCEKNPADPVIRPPLITALSINHGPFNTSVTITGFNFSADISSNIVKFNGVQATITSATTNQLTVSVPMGAGTGVILVNVSGSEVSGPLFTYEYTTTVSTINCCAIFNAYPTGVAVDDQNNIYVADLTNNQIRKIDTLGVVSILAGDATGDDGFTDGVGTDAKFNYPWAIEVDAQGTLYVAESGNCCIRKITPAGLVTTLAGNGQPGYVDGPLDTAQFGHPDGIAIDGQGNLYISDRDNYEIRKITPTGVVSSLFADIGTSPLSSPCGLITNPDGDLYVADNIQNQIIKLPSGGGWVAFGRPYAGYYEGPVTFAQFSGPTDIVSDAQGNIYIADAGNNRIRKLTPGGIVSTLAGDGNRGHVDGPANLAQFNNPMGIAIDKQGNIYVADAGNHTLRKITII